jgi:trk system potassium uptake protein
LGIFKNINNLVIERLTRAQTLMLGYLAFVSIGTILLMLPVSSESGTSLSFIDAVFTSVSAVSGTGITVVDTGSYFSVFGQIIILTFIQIGNIGYMLFFALAVIFFGGRLSLANKLMLKESISHSTIDLKIFIRKVFKYTFIIEFVCAVILSVYWLQHFPVLDAIKYGVFHSISAFCTAGFSLFPNNLENFGGSFFFSIIIILTAFAGGCGFYVIYDVSMFIKSAILKRTKYRLTIHTKTVLTVSLTIISIATVLLFLFESNENTAFSGNRLLYSFFQASAASTTVGYNTVDISRMNDSSLFMLVPVMFIGASPSGTGGGIKTTVFILMLISLFAFIRDRKNINIYKRNIPYSIINRAFSIGLLAVSWLFVSALLISVFEDHSFISVLFESTSALGNIGLSAGITSDLTVYSKAVLSLSMLIGRIGPLLVGYTLLGSPKPENYEYPEANILIV